MKPPSVLLALQQATLPDSIEAAIDLAQRLEAELVGLFVQDADLLRSSELPFVRQVRFSTATDEELDPARLRRELHTLALSARRFDSCLFQYFSAWLAMLKGDVLGAYELQRKALRTATEMGLPFFEVLCRLGLAQILVECGDERKGVTHLRELRRLAKTIDNALLEFMTLLSYAHIALNHGRVSSGRKALAYAFHSL